MVCTGGERRKGGCRKEWKVFAGAEVYGGIEKNGQSGGMGKRSVAWVMWSSHWNPPRGVGRGVVRNGWVQGRGSEPPHRSHSTLPATKTTANSISPLVSPPVFSNGTGRSVSTESKQAQALHTLCLGPGKSLPLFGPRLSQRQERPRMVVHICRVFAVQSSQLFAATREVNHNTCYVQRSCRLHGGGGAAFRSLRTGEERLARDSHPRVWGNC